MTHATLTDAQCAANEERAAKGHAPAYDNDGRYNMTPGAKYHDPCKERGTFTVTMATVRVTGDSERVILHGVYDGTGTPAMRFAHDCKEVAPASNLDAPRRERSGRGFIHCVCYANSHKELNNEGTRKLAFFITDDEALAAAMILVKVGKAVEIDIASIDKSKALQLQQWAINKARELNVAITPSLTWNGETPYFLTLNKPLKLNPVHE